MFLDQKLIELVIDRLEKRVEILLAKYGIKPVENRQPETVSEVIESMPKLKVRCPSVHPKTGMQCGMILNEDGLHDPAMKNYLHGQSLAGIGWD